MVSCDRVTDNRNMTKFDGTFFNVWKHHMILLFKAKRFWSIVEGTEPKPKAPTTIGAQTLPTTGKGSLVEWEDRDTLALSIMNNCLKNLILCHIQHCKSSSSAWKQLCDMYETKDVISRMYLCDKLQSLKMKDMDSVTKYMHNFRSILERLASIGSPVGDKDAILSLMRSMPSGYKPLPSNFEETTRLDSSRFNCGSPSRGDTIERSWIWQ